MKLVRKDRGSHGSGMDNKANKGIGKQDQSKEQISKINQVNHSIISQTQNNHIKEAQCITREHREQYETRKVKLSKKDISSETGIIYNNKNPIAEE